MSLCPACGSENRDAARFCRTCGKSITPGAGPVSAPGAAAQVPNDWRTDRVAVAAAPSAAIPQVPRGTVVRDEYKSPGTVLHSQKAELPVCGWLVILKGRRKGRDFRIDKENSVLGRDGSCDYVVEDDSVSRQHVRIRKEGDAFVLFDLGSGNGSYVNGEPVQRVELQDGDVLKVGETLILFKDAKPRVSLQVADAPPNPGS